MAHDFIKFPELTNSQMELYYFESPHKQILEDFRGRVEKVVDGDTITVSTDFRDFNFPVRFIGTNAPEMNEGGKESKEWLRERIEGKTVEILIDSENRVGKFGRLIGAIISNGMNINEESIRSGQSTTFENRKEGLLPNIDKELSISQWL